MLLGVWQVTCNQGHREIRVEYSATNPTVVGIEEHGRIKRLRTGQEYAFDNDTVVSLHERTMKLRTAGWDVEATSKVWANIVDTATCAEGRCILNVKVGAPVRSGDAGCVWCGAARERAHVGRRGPEADEAAESAV